MLTHLPAGDSPGDLILSVDNSINDKNKHVVRKSLDWIHVICMLSSFTVSSYLVLGKNILVLEVTYTVEIDLISPVVCINIKDFELS